MKSTKAADDLEQPQIASVAKAEIIHVNKARERAAVARQHSRPDLPYGLESCSECCCCASSGRMGT
jgi:hypothetical protein